MLLLFDVGIRVRSWHEEDRGQMLAFVLLYSVHMIEFLMTALSSSSVWQESDCQSDDFTADGIR